MKKIYVIVTGTDPKSKKGGIGFALPGYLNAMESACIEFEAIPTYSPETFSGKFWFLLKNIPLILKCINNDKKRTVIIYSHAGAGLSLFRESLVVSIAKLFNVKSVMQLHAPEVNDYLKSRWKKRLFLAAIANTDRLNVLLPWWKEQLIQANIKKILSILPNPLPYGWEKTAKKIIVHKNSNENINILALARIEPGKGVELVLESMPYLDSNYTLTIAGDGSLLNALKSRSKELSVSNRVTFAGWVSGNDKQKLFDKADIFCLPSSYDSFGMGFLEAMANGLPVVALDWGPISDIVPDAQVGFLVRYADPKLLAKKIKKLSDHEVRKKMGSAGKKWVLAEFSADKVGFELKNIFEELINEN